MHYVVQFAWLLNVILALSVSYFSRKGRFRIFPIAVIDYLTTSLSSCHCPVRPRRQVRSAHMTSKPPGIRARADSARLRARHGMKSRSTGPPGEEPMRHVGEERCVRRGRRREVVGEGARLISRLDIRVLTRTGSVVSFRFQRIHRRIPFRLQEHSG